MNNMTGLRSPRGCFGCCRSGLATIPFPRTAGKHLHSQVSWLSSAMVDFAGTRLSWLRSVSFQWRLSDTIREWPRGTNSEPLSSYLPCLIMSSNRHHFLWRCIGATTGHTSIFHQSIRLRRCWRRISLLAIQSALQKSVHVHRA